MGREDTSCACMNACNTAIHALTRLAAFMLPCQCLLPALHCESVLCARVPRMVRVARVGCYIPDTIDWENIPLDSVLLLYDRRWRVVVFIQISRTGVQGSL